MSQTTLLPFFSSRISVALCVLSFAACSGGSPSPSPAPPDGTSAPTLGATCEASQCGPALGMPAQQCADGTVGGNTGRCIVQPGGACGWEIRSCPEPTTGGMKPCRPTGCSGTVCADDEVVTTCEARPEHACYKSARCERSPAGACGWVQTPELAACLANPPKG